MKTTFEARFEEEIEKARLALSKRGGIKKMNKVCERIGRARQKFPSVQSYYTIEVIANEKKPDEVKDIVWVKEKEKELEKTSSLGVYFLRTDMEMDQEETIWMIYNTIREIKASFCTLKNDLDLRPIYHKNDDATMSHLHLGILAYWLVNTIRYQLKAKNIHNCWGEIVRIGNTQKVITTTGQNTFDKFISVRKCSIPEHSLKEIYKALKLPEKPFRKRKSVVLKVPLEKKDVSEGKGLYG